MAQFPSDLRQAIHGGDGALLLQDDQQAVSDGVGFKEMHLIFAVAVDDETGRRLRGRLRLGISADLMYGKPVGQRPGQGR